MNQKENDKKQRKLIREFDKELFSYTGQVAWFMPALFSFLMLIPVSIPFQEYKKEGDYFLVYVMLYLAVWLSYMVLLPYVNSNDALTPQKKRSKTFDKLKYLPVSRKQYNIVRMEYVFRYVRKLTLIGMVLQCVFSLIDKSFTLENIIYVFSVLFAAPMIAGWLLLWLPTKS